MAPPGPPGPVHTPKLACAGRRCTWLTASVWRTGSASSTPPTAATSADGSSIQVQPTKGECAAARHPLPVAGREDGYGQGRRPEAREPGRDAGSAGRVPGPGSCRSCWAQGCRCYLEAGATPHGSRSMTGARPPAPCGAGGQALRPLPRADGGTTAQKWLLRRIRSLRKWGRGVIGGGVGVYGAGRARGLRPGGAAGLVGGGGVGVPHRPAAAPCRARARRQRPPRRCRGGASRPASGSAGTGPPTRRACPVPAGPRPGQDKHQSPHCGLRMTRSGRKPAPACPQARR